jgi:tetratricopeptide (TPR) repeat protein
MPSCHTRLKIENNTNTDIINISVSEIDNYDWDGHSRPDHNFHGFSIPAYSSKEEREEVNYYASNCPFRMTLTFRDGRKCSFRIHQKYAIKGSSGFSHEGRGIDINYNRYGGEGHHGKLVVTLTDSQQHLEEQRESEAQRLNKQGLALVTTDPAGAIVKYDAALQKATKQSTIDSIKNNKASALFNQGKELWNHAWIAENDEENDRSNEATQKFQEAKSKFESAHNLDINHAEYLRNLSIVSLKLDGNVCLDQAMLLHKNANKLYTEASKLKEQGRYDEAKDKYDAAQEKYQTAKQKFTEGLNFDEPRFNVLVEWIKEQVTSIDTSLQEMQSIQLSQSFAGVTFSPSTETTSDTVESNTIGEFYEVNDAI